jgi:hypothetical protein
MTKDEATKIVEEIKSRHKAFNTQYFDTLVKFEITYSACEQVFAKLKRAQMYTKLTIAETQAHECIQEFFQQYNKWAKEELLRRYKEDMTVKHSEKLQAAAIDALESIVGLRAEDFILSEKPSRLNAAVLRASRQRMKELQ